MIYLYWFDSLRKVATIILVDKIRNIKAVVFKRKKLAILLAIIVAVVIGFIFYSQNKKEVKETAVVKSGDLKQELVLSGEIDALEKAKLAFPISGKIVFIGAKEGEIVKKNQLLASLDQASTLKNYQTAVLDYNKQRNTFEQTKDDQGFDKVEDAVNDEIKRVLQNNQYDLDKTVVSLELKDLAKRDSYLYSPIDGIVTNLGDYHVGGNEVAASPIFEVVNSTTLYFSVLADQTEVVDLVEGEPCEIVLDSFPDKTFSGVVENISFSPSEDESGTVYRIKVSLNVEDVNIRLGMTGDATFVTKEVFEVLYLPVKFVKTDDKGSFVIINEKGEKKYIKVGLETDDYVEITSGLSDKQVVYD